MTGYDGDMMGYEGYEGYGFHIPIISQSYPWDMNQGYDGDMMGYDACK